MFLSSINMISHYGSSAYKRSEELERRRSGQRFFNPSIDPDTGERIRRLTPLENYQMQQPSSWGVRF